MTRNIKEFVNHARSFVPANFPAEVGEDHVCILMGLCNGAENLEEQLASLAEQSHSDWSLIVSDDGSSDDWFPIVSRFAEAHAPGRTWVTRGPEQGFARNFLSLACQAGPMVPFAAFCDQDDVWLRYKLARAISMLRSVRQGLPAVYVSRTMICDSDLQQLRPSLLFKRPPGFGNALVQSIGGGNTMVMNRAALDLVQDSAPRATGIVSHDWWVYQLVTGAGGTVCYDQTPTVLYRQHGQNLIGANDTLLSSLARMRRVLQGQFRQWNAANAKALDRARPWLTEEARLTLDHFKAARSGSLIGRLRALRASGAMRQRKRGTAALWCAALMNKL